MLQQCGLLAVAACEDASEAQAKKARVGPYDNPKKNSPGDCQVGQPSPCCQIGKQRAHSAGCGEEWWGWILGGNTTWRSRGPPRALQPPTPKSRHATDPARRKGTQGNREGHRHTEPGKCANARLVPPRESLVLAPRAQRKSPRRSQVSGIFQALALSEFIPVPFPGKTDKSRYHRPHRCADRCSPTKHRPRPGRPSSQ